MSSPAPRAAAAPAKVTSHQRRFMAHGSSPGSRCLPLNFVPGGHGIAGPNADSGN